MAGAEHSDLPVLHMETGKSFLPELHLSTLLSQLHSNAYLLSQTSLILFNYVLSSHLYHKHPELGATSDIFHIHSYFSFTTLSQVFKA